MRESIDLPIKMSSDVAIRNLATINSILQRCGQDPVKASDIQKGDTFILKYAFNADYSRGLVENLRHIKGLAEMDGARAVGRVRMYLLEVLRELEAL